MKATSQKRIAKVKLTPTKRTVENLQPADTPWIAWDDRLVGFGVRVQPSGTKAFVVNYRIGRGGRKAPNRRIVIGRYGLVTPDEARRLSMGFENVPLLGFENVPLFRGDWVPAEGWVDGIWRGCGRIGGGG